jgi:hypothetical protein
MTFSVRGVRKEYKYNSKGKEEFYYQHISLFYSNLINMSRTLFSLLVLFIIATATTVLAAPADACRGFRITSPTLSGLQWTAGQCYQVSYDIGANPPSSSYTVSVDLYNASNNKKVASLVKNEPTSSIGATKPFNMDAPSTGTYYYLVIFNNGKGCAPKKSVTFHVTYNPNSPPATC